jgi:release factor glutamine methyltransferase
MTSTVEVLASAAKRLSDAGIASARLEARVLLAHVLDVESSALIGSGAIDTRQMELFETYVQRRVAREPLAYIVGHKEFFSLDFAVGPGVLVPRPETETLVEEALREFPDTSAELAVLDIGTGSGCLIAAFLSRYENASGLAVDVSPEALIWAERNLARHGLSDRCRFVSGVWNAEGAFDVVFANPPYLTDEEFAEAAPEIRRYEPRLAFVAGCDGLASYRTIAPQIASVLKPAGLAFVEVGKGQARDVQEILEDSGLEVRRIAPDLAGIPRCLIAGRRLVGRQGPQKTVGKAPATR